MAGQRIKANDYNWIVRNNIELERYIDLYSALVAFFAVLYSRYVASYSNTGIKAFRIATIVFVIEGISLILSWEIERNWVSIITGTVFPFLVCVVIELWPISIVFRIAVIIGEIGIIASSVFRVYPKAFTIKRAATRRRVFIIKTVCLVRILSIPFLLGICIYGKTKLVKQQIVFHGDIDYVVSDTRNGIVDYNNSLSANIATVAKIDSDGGWNNLTIEEKMEVLETIVRIECRYFGMHDCAPSLELKYLEEGLQGKYDSVSDTITISYNLLEDSASNGYLIVQVLCHEMHHRYAHYQVRLLEYLKTKDNSEEFANLLLLEPAGAYIDEMNNYIFPRGESPLVYGMYKTQRLERDAELYSIKSVQYYREEIRSFLGSDCTETKGGDGSEL